MTNMDRLFGKQLSNILEHQSFIQKHRSTNRYNLKTRGISVDDMKRNVQKKLNSQVSKNQTVVHKKADQQQIKDDQMVPAYFDECLARMFKQEEGQYRLHNYINNQSQITEKMRGILLDWIYDLHLKFKMFSQTLYLTTMIIDRYLTVKDVPKTQLQLLGTAAFFIAAKYQQTYQVPQLRDLVHYAANTFTRQEAIQMEASIIQVLNFDLILVTSFRFFEPLAKLAKLEDKNFHLAQYVMELSLLETKFLQYKPSLIASSAIYLINKIRKRSESWPDIMLAATGYEEKQLKTCARQLCYLLQKAEELGNSKALRKKFSTTKYSEVTKVRLERKK